MLLTRTSRITGKTRTLDIDITKSQLLIWQLGMHSLPEIAPTLSRDDIEFIMTGITKKEWTTAFGSEADFGRDIL